MNPTKILGWLFLLLLLTGCSKQLVVPAFQTIEEYQSWANRHNVHLKFISVEGEEVDSSQYQSILTIEKDEITSGDTLEIIVKRKGESITITPIMENRK